jgi:hypothetical protein
MERAAATPRTLAQTLTLVFGVAFLGVGIIGFIPGLTTELYGGLDFAGKDSEAEIFGIFQTSWLHNIVHLLFGVAGVALARTWESARSYLLGAGVLYVVLFVYGILVGNEDDANFVPINNADDWLHLILAAALLAAWWVSGREAPRMGTAGAPPPP